MTNFEKYKDAILKITSTGYQVGLVNGVPHTCDGLACDECELIKNIYCTTSFIEWLYEEYKEPAPTLTPKERAFCEMFDDKQRTYISRNAYGNLCVEWCERKVWIDKTLFPFIECKTGRCVAGLLKLEVCDD